METVKGMCRLCLENCANIYIYSDSSTIHEKLLSYCKLKVFKNDGLPEEICRYCLQQLDVVVDFINKCEESDRILRNKFSPASPTPDELFIKKECSDSGFEINDNYNKHNIAHRSPVSGNGRVDIKEEINYCENNQTEEDSSYFDASVSESNFEKLDLKSNLKLECSDDAYYCRDKKSTNKKRSRKRKLRDDDKKANRKRKFEDDSSLCPVCGIYFPLARTLRVHLQKHSGVLHKCSKCPKSFSTKEFLRVHELRHICVKNFSCDMCSSTFASSYLNRKHYQLVHQRIKAVACKLCDKVLCSSRGLAQHMKIHTGEKQYECQLCEKKFTHKLSLTCHTRVHTGEQPYACQYCEKRFSISKSLREHERLHTGEKPYSCPLCPKRFEQLSNMKSHFRYNHKGLDLKQAQELKTKEQLIVSVKPLPNANPNPNVDLTSSVNSISTINSIPNVDSVLNLNSHTNDIVFPFIDSENRIISQIKEENKTFS